MEEDGYMPIGESSFNSKNVPQWQILQQAQNVNAEIVLVYEHYTDTQSGAVPLTVPDYSTTKTDFSGSIYGTGGNARFSGEANQSTYGTRTTYIPYHVRRFDYYASYWVKAKPRAFGVRFRELTGEERRSIGSNKGGVVEIVMRNSPAFNADIVEGDIIKSMQGEIAIDAASCVALTQKYRGQEVEIEIVRNSKTLMKRVKLNE